MSFPPLLAVPGDRLTRTTMGKERYSAAMLRGSIDMNEWIKFLPDAVPMAIAKWCGRWPSFGPRGLDTGYLELEYHLRGSFGSC